MEIKALQMHTASQLRPPSIAFLWANRENGKQASVAATSVCSSARPLVSGGDKNPLHLRLSLRLLLPLARRGLFVGSAYTEVLLADDRIVPPQSHCISAHGTCNLQWPSRSARHCTRQSRNVEGSDCKSLPSSASGASCSHALETDQRDYLTLSARPPSSCRLHAWLSPRRPVLDLTCKSLETVLNDSNLPGQPIISTYSFFAPGRTVQQPSINLRLRCWRYHSLQAFVLPKQSVGP